MSEVLTGKDVEEAKNISFVYGIGWQQKTLADSEENPYLINSVRFKVLYQILIMMIILEELLSVELKEEQLI